MSWWVIPTRREWVAAADSVDTLQRASNCAVLLHCLNKVAAARRVKTALLAEDRTQKDLIQPDKADQDPTWQVDEHFPEC